MLICGPLLTLIIMVGLFGPAIAPHDPLRVDTGEAYRSPTAQHWLGTFARLTRGQVLSLREREWAVAERVIGASPDRIMLAHIFPSALNPSDAHASFKPPSRSSLKQPLPISDLGRSPQTLPGAAHQLFSTSLTNMMWWMTAGPGLANFITVLTFNLFGDAPRDAADPRQRGAAKRIHLMR
jgi:peptide/nickel transport system permease protein